MGSKTKNAFKKVSISAVILFSVFLLAGCGMDINSVDQPATATAGSSITVQLNCDSGGASDFGTANGMFAILLPDGWNVTDAYFYKTTEPEILFHGTEDIDYSGLDNPPANYKWYRINSNDAFSLNASFVVMLTINVGQTPGDYNLKYYLGNSVDGWLSGPWSEDITITPDDNNSDNNGDNNTSSEPDKAHLDSWEAYRYTDPNKPCSDRLKLTIKGSHFSDDSVVKIGNHEASSVNKKSNKELVAKFCYTKLISGNIDHKRKITVKNPDTGTKEADKKIDLDNITFGATSIGNNNGNNFNPNTTEGIKNIQQKLVSLGLLGSQYITGIYGPITTEAVKKFQADNGLPQTGFVGPLTRAKLGEK
jgi:hypothetical protein